MHLGNDSMIVAHKPPKANICEFECEINMCRVVRGGPLSC